MKTNTIINVDQLASLIKNNATNLRIFDCRFNLHNKKEGQKFFSKEHIKGAQYLDLEKDLSGTIDDKSGRHPLPNKIEFANRLGAFGVNETSQVVVYDNDTGMFASRAWWMFRWLGHSEVYVLNGGLKNWLASGNQLTCEDNKYPTTNFIINDDATFVKSFLLNEVSDNLHTTKQLLIDARAPERYAGENETIDNAVGHIPSAKNRFFMDNMSGGLFKSKSQLREEFSELLGDCPNNDINEDVVHYCGSGVTACHNVLAMEIAGYKSALYSGSWSQWSCDKSRPVKTGSSA